jgi:uncharacterized protein (TIGR00730 family)
MAAIGSVCVYCGSSMGTSPRYREVARALGRALAAHGIRLVFGGGRIGLMGEVADAVMAAGGQAIGVIPDLLQKREKGHLGITELRVVASMHERKNLMFELSDAFIILPGGFGTLDEAFELLTLLQTGKADPSPIVLLDVPGGSYWQRWRRFIDEEVVTRGLVSEEDESLYAVTDDVTAATDEILGFYRNYHSRRFVGDLMVLRIKKAPTPEELDQLNDEFADIVTEGAIELTEALPDERASNDHVNLPRLAMKFDLLHHGRLRQLIDTLNRL